MDKLIEDSVVLTDFLKENENLKDTIYKHFTTVNFDLLKSYYGDDSYWVNENIVENLAKIAEDMN